MIESALTSVLLATLEFKTPTLGVETAPIKVEVFEDFECPYCKQFATGAFPQIKKEYIDTGKVYYIHRDFPLEMHKNSMSAAAAGRCANEQGLFWKMSERMYKGQSYWDDSTRPFTYFRHYMNVTGGDVKKFNACLKAENMLDVVGADIRLGLDGGIYGTPGFLINGNVISGAHSFETFQQIFEAELSNKEWEVEVGGSGVKVKTF